MDWLECPRVYFAFLSAHLSLSESLPGLAFVAAVSAWGFLFHSLALLCHLCHLSFLGFPTLVSAAFHSFCISDLAFPSLSFPILELSLYMCRPFPGVFPPHSILTEFSAS